MIKKFFKWIFKEELFIIEKNNYKISNINDEIIRNKQKINDINSKLNSLIGVAAIDFNLKEESYIVVAAKTKNGDRVKLINLQPGLSQYEYNKMIKDITDKYSVRITHFDAANNIKREFMKATEKFGW